jgi:hypothetical protein
MTRRFNVLLALVLGVAFGVWTERAVEPAPAAPPAPVVRIVRVEQPAVQPAEPTIPACHAEDERIWGVGNYAHGRYERYVCRHIDWISDLLDPITN